MDNDTTIDTLRQRLLARRSAFIGRVARTQDVPGEFDERPAEVEEEAQDLNRMRLLAQLGDRGRAEIVRSTSRSAHGAQQYGSAESCEEPIDVARLEVLPTARLCTTCAEANERGARMRAPVTSALEEVEEQL
jgi:RNA polymerase-binding transcription factor DksA